MTEMELCWAYNMYSCNVTITGVDDKVDVGWLVDTSKKYPFVEWGILIGSEDRRGTSRYPSLSWIERASAKLGSEGCRFAIHICGNLSKGYQEESSDHQLFMQYLFSMVLVPQQVRIQLNGTRTKKFKTPMPFVEHIMVAKDVGQAQMYSNSAGTFESSVLIDASGGRGVAVDLGALKEEVVSNLDMFHRGCKIGLAGGIDVSSVQYSINDVIVMSEVVGGSRRWVDLETGARTNNEFDKDKVIAVLEAAEAVLLRWDTMSFRVIQQGNGGKRDVVLMYLVGDRAQELASRVGPDACVVAESVSNYSSEVTPWRKALEAVGAGSDFEVGRIWLIGFSAGCQGVRAQLNEGCPADVVLACDGIHGSRPTPTEAQTASWLRLASYARSGRAVFSVSCSKTPATTFLTTEDMAKVTFGWNGCYGSYSSPCVDRDGDFRIYGATNGGGSPADEHMDQLRKLLPRMIDDAKSGASMGWGLVVAAAVLLGLAVWYELAEAEDSNDDAILQLDVDSCSVKVCGDDHVVASVSNDAQVAATALRNVRSFAHLEVVKIKEPLANLCRCPVFSSVLDVAELPRLVHLSIETVPVQGAEYELFVHLGLSTGSELKNDPRHVVDVDVSAFGHDVIRSPRRRRRCRCASRR